MMLKITHNACKGLLLGIFGFFTPLLSRMKPELLLNKISRAARSDVVLETQVGAQELAALHLEPGCIWGVPRRAGQCSTCQWRFWQRHQWPGAPRARRGFAGAHTRQMRCHSVCSHVLCTNCPLLALQSSWLQEAQQRLSKDSNESGSDVFPSRGNPLA